MAAAGGALALASATAALAATPKKGGILNFAVVAEPPTIDCHAVTTFAFAHPARPHYSTLLKWEGDVNKPVIAGDLAKSWEASADGLTYTFKLFPNVKFHDGAPMTSADVKASYERIINPPQGVVSARRALFQAIRDIETPDATTVVFKLKSPNASMLINFASPWNCIYRAEKLKEDPNFPEKTILGTGAFKFVEYVKGSHWRGEKFDGYFRENRPYLDGYKAFFVKSNAVVPGMIGNQFNAEFRGRTPKERDQLVAGMKDDALVTEGPWVTSLLFTFNVQKKPFDDVRVRRALTMAIDRHAGGENLSKISLLKFVGGLLRPGYELARTQEELAQFPGFSKDIEKSRAEAKRLLAEAGVPNLKLRLVNRNVAEPYTPGGIYLIDQWRRIGVDAEHVQLETKLFFDAMASGNFDILLEFISDFADDPSSQFDKFLTKEKSSVAASGHTDKEMDRLFDLQAAAVTPEDRRRYVRAFEERALNEVYAAPLLWWQRIVVRHKKIQGWNHQNNHFTETDLVNVWLDQ
jgi:peptide/nickel transport system substrate-binding protein